MLFSSVATPSVLAAGCQLGLVAVVNLEKAAKNRDVPAALVVLQGRSAGVL